MSRNFRASVLFVSILFSFFLPGCSKKHSPQLAFKDAVYPLVSYPEKLVPDTAKAWKFPADVPVSDSAGKSLFLNLSVSHVKNLSMALVYGSDSALYTTASLVDLDTWDGDIRIGLVMGLQSPEGIMIQYTPADGVSSSEVSVSLTKAEILPLTVGWCRYPVVTYGFGPDGGTARFSQQCPATFDFSSVSDMTSAGLLPSVLVSFENQPILNDRQQVVEFTVGTEQVSVRQSPSQRSMHLYADLFRNKASRISVASNKTLVSGVLYIAEEHVAGTPLEADPGIILSWPKSAWENPAYQLYRWEMLPQVLIFDFADYGVQDDMLKRLAFYTEKAGFKGRLAPDAEIANLHGYNAHDYRAESLAAFFSAAAVQNFPLNDREIELRTILLQSGIIVPSEEQPYAAGTGAIISISRESSASLRSQLLTHEAFHALFFSDPEFRSLVATVYDTMDQRTLEFLLLYFKTQSSLGYDTEDRYLMHTELMSYLLQQDRAATADYYITRSNYKSMFTADEALCDYIKETKAAGFTDAHRRLETYVFEKYGLKGGRVTLVQR